MDLSFSRWRLGADFIVISVAAIALHVALARQNGVIAGGGLMDTDAFMRLIRVQELWQTGDWYQNVTSSLGAPDGLSLHWTRPLDLLILLPAFLLHLAGLTMDRAIYWTGAAISPVLQLAACVAAAVAAKPIWEQHGAWRVAALMVLFNGAAITYCLAGRPDHHSLGLLLTILAAGQAIRAMLTPSNVKLAFRAGAWAGAGIWVSPEALLGMAPALVTFGLLWLTAGAQNRQWACLGRYFSLGVSAIVLLAIGIEQPPAHWLVPEYDKVSILHLLIGAVAAIDFRIAEALPWAGWRRLAGAIAIAALSGLALALLFPHFYLGPLGNITNQGVKTFLDEITEMGPLWPVNAASADQFFGMIGNSLAALPVIPYCLWRWRRQPAFPAALLLSVSYLAALIGALLHQRLAVPLNAYGAILGCGLFAMLCDLAMGAKPVTRAMTRLVACVIVVFGGQIWVVVANWSEPAPAATIAACQPKPVADWLNAAHPGSRDMDPTGAVRHTPIILTESINYPPELAYRTGYRFVGGPYHRGIDDIADMYDAAIGTDDNAIRGIIARRQADFILICVTEVPKAIGESAPNSLYHRLLRGEAPAWLQPTPMSAEASREFRLFAVKR